MEAELLCSAKWKRWGFGSWGLLVGEKTSWKCCGLVGEICDDADSGGSGEFGCEFARRWWGPAGGGAERRSFR